MATFVLRPPHWRAEIEQSSLLDEKAPGIIDSAGSFPAIPLIVLTLPTADWLGEMSPELPAFWAEAQQKLAGISPQGKLVVSEKSGHMIPHDQPELIIDAVRQVVEAVRANAIDV